MLPCRADAGRGPHSFLYLGKPPPGLEVIVELVATALDQVRLSHPHLATVFKATVKPIRKEMGIVPTTGHEAPESHGQLTNLNIGILKRAVARVVSHRRDIFI